jgi:hypothetical protein
MVEALDSVKVPSIENILACTSEEEFSNLLASRTKEINLKAGAKHFFLASPDVAFRTGFLQSVKASMLAMFVISSLKAAALENEDEDENLLEQKSYEDLLIWLWVLATQGTISEIRLTMPEESTRMDHVARKARTLLEGVPPKQAAVAAGTTSHRVTVTFMDQKNGRKMDSRTHERTGDQILCPVRRAAALTKRILHSIPGSNASTPINTVKVGDQVLQITGTFLRDQLRKTCREMGGKAILGYDPNEIGTKSIRSGSAMALFLMNHAVHRIMILGRWYSDAFLVYIRPQVLEWTNNMSQDMIYLDSFFHLPDPAPADQQDDPRNRNNRSHFNGPESLLTPRLHLHH